MFHKEGSFTKTQGKLAKDVPLKKSERRKLRDTFRSMVAQSGGPGPGTATDDDEDMNLADYDSIFLDSKSDISLRKLRLKDAKSNAGATNIYIRTPSPSLSATGNNTMWPYTLSNQVLFINIGNTMLPSLALLSVLPVEVLNALPSVMVHAQVSKYLCRGADLMRSGIISMNNDGKGKFSWVTIKATNNPQPFAIGFVTKGTESNTIGPGTKGVGVEIIHCYGDEIYTEQLSSMSSTMTDGCVSQIGGQMFDQGNYGNVGFIEGKMVYGLMKVDDEEGEQESDENGVAIGKLSLNEHENDTSEPQDASESGGKEYDEHGNGIQSENNDRNDDGDSDNDDNDPEQDLLYAFHNALVNISKSDLPMATSTFYSQHVLPSRKEGTFIDLKSTRYKKIGTFLLEQAHSGLITIGPSKDGKDAVGFLKSVDRSHIQLRDARKRKKAAAGEEGDGGNGSSKKKKTKMAVANLYVIPNHIVTLMRLDQDDVKATNAKSEERRGTGYLTAPECRDILNQYILSNQLVNELDPEMVTLDGPLCDALFRKTKKQIAREGIERNVYDESVTRKELNTKWLECMDHAHAIVAMPGSRIISMKRGSPPMVQVEVEARQSRKKFITRVRNLEEYSINPADFARDVSKRFACSSSIENDPSTREALKKGRVEVEFQGHLVEELQALLTGNEKLSSHGGVKNSEYSLPKGVIDVKLKKGVPKRKK